MNTSDYFKTGIVLLLVVFLAVFAAIRFSGKGPVLGDAGIPLIYNTPTMATTSVGTSIPVLLLGRSGGRQFATVCNSSPTSTNDLMLQFDATSSVVGLNAPGQLVSGNSCAEINPNNRLFVGDLYGIFTANTATVQTLVK